MWWFYSFGRGFKKYKNYASWRGNQGILVFTYLPLQIMIQGYKYVENFNLLDPSSLGFWQVLAVLFVFASMLSLSSLPAVFSRSLEDTKKLEEVYRLV
jgi:hypothetical protein